MSLGFISQPSSRLHLENTVNVASSNKPKILAIFLSIASIISIAVYIILLLQKYITLWYLPISFSLLGYVVFLYPFHHKDISKIPLWIIYSPCVVVLFSYLKVLITFFVAVWMSTFILATLIPLKEKNMINYNFDSIHHTISSINIYGIIRGFSAYFVKLGLSNNISVLIPFFIANIETLGMFILNSHAYSFSVRSFMFVQYAILKSSIFLALPIVEQFIIHIIMNGSVL